METTTIVMVSCGSRVDAILQLLWSYCKLTMSRSAAMYGMVRQTNRDRLYYLLIWPPICLVARVLLSKLWEGS